jgi:hypothetical protein
MTSEDPVDPAPGTDAFAATHAGRLEGPGTSARLAHDLANELGLILNYTAIVAQELLELAAGRGEANRFDLLQIDLAEAVRAADRAVDLTWKLQALAENGDVSLPRQLTEPEICGDVGSAAELGRGRR